MTQAREFIERFTPIPEYMWCIGTMLNLSGQSCALGWCQAYGTERLVLGREFRPKYVLNIGSLFGWVTIKVKNSFNTYKVGERVRGINAVAAINNGETEEYQQPTAKQRTLAALWDIENGVWGQKKDVYPDKTAEIALSVKETIETADRIIAKAIV